MRHVLGRLKKLYKRNLAVSITITIMLTLILGLITDHSINEYLKHRNRNFTHETVLQQLTEHHPFIVAAAIFIIIIWIFMLFVINININKRTARMIELLGYGFLFFALIWQFMILEPTQYSETEVNHKLDYIWEYLHNTHVSSDDFQQRMIEKAKDDRNFEVSYYIYENAPGFSDPAVISKIVFGFIYLLSTICIAIGRFHDIRDDVVVFEVGQQSVNDRAASGESTSGLRLGLLFNKTKSKK